VDYAKDKTSQRGSSPVQIILIIPCLGLVAILALPIFNSLMQSGCLPYGPDSPRDKFPEPQTTVILSVLGVMTALALIGGYAINTGADKLHGWLFTGILIAGLWGLGIFSLNLL
jgi:FtsH-binding integral membrane protein